VSDPLDGLDCVAIERLLGHRFADRRLLGQAFTHSSFVYEQAQGSVPSGSASADVPPGPKETGERSPGGTNYERLEFLGDAVLGLLLAEHAYASAPDALVGSLTTERARLARRASLAAAAERLSLGQHVRLSGGEARQGGARRRRLLADLFEAVLGAIYLDGGAMAARRFVEAALIGPDRCSGGAFGGEADAKSLLQERLQARGQGAPVYSVIEVSGPPHDPAFLVEVLIEGRPAGRGTGGSRREAEQQAARVALSESAKG
jgi:ribonuclease-3